MLPLAPADVVESVTPSAGVSPLDGLCQATGGHFQNNHFYLPCLHGSVHDGVDGGVHDAARRRNVMPQAGALLFKQAA